MKFHRITQALNCLSGFSMFYTEFILRMIINYNKLGGSEELEGMM